MLGESFPHKVLLTGGSGFVGGRLRAALLEAGADVVALVREASPVVRDGRSAVVNYEEPETLRQVIEAERPDYLFHVAGATKGVSLEDFRTGNVMPTRHLIEAIEASGHAPRRFLLVSSLTAYGPSNAGPPLREQDVPEPVEHYGRSKLEAEGVLQAVGDRFPWTILRPAGVYGPGDVDYFELFKAASKGLNVFFGNRAKLQSVVYVDDLVRAIVQAALCQRTVGKGYFICDGQPVTWEALQERIVDGSGRRARTLNLPRAVISAAAVAGEWMTRMDGRPRLANRQKAIMDAQQAWLCSSESAAEDFAFDASVGLDEGVRRTFAWYRDEGWI